MAAEIRLADCLDPVAGLASLGDKSVDVVITDPPYSEHAHTKQVRGVSLPLAVPVPRNALSERRELGFKPISVAGIRAVSGQLARLARRWVLVFCDLESAPIWAWALASNVGVLDYVRTMLWHRIGSAPQFSGDRPAVSDEAIVLAHPPGRKRWNGGGRGGCYPFAIEHAQRRHSTQKPLGLMQALVRDFSDPGELILDPFAGSGTTGVAAITLGRNFLGWERDPRWQALATRRLRRTREQLELAIPVRRPRPRQVRLPL